MYPEQKPAPVDIEALSKQHSNWLTPAAVREIIDSMPGMGCLPDFQRQKVAEVAAAVADFSSVNYHHRQAPLGTWLYSGLDSLSEECFKLTGREPITRELLIQQFEAQAAEALAEHQAWFAEEPREFCEYLHKPAGWTMSADYHPWGQDTLTVCRAWLQTSAYEVWKTYTQIRTKLHDRLEEDLADLAIGFDGSGLGRDLEDMAKEIFETKLKAVRLAAGVK